MKGFLGIDGEGGIRMFELPEDRRISLGAGAVDLPMAGASGVVELAWRSRDGCWVIESGRPLVNGAAAGPGEPIAHQDLLEIGGSRAVLLVRMAPPRFQGAEVTEIPLKGGRISFGTGTDATVNLDPADAALRGGQVLVSREGGRWQVEDGIGQGVLLNGRVFRKETLVIGDCLQMGSYRFEFTGFSLRRVDLMGGAKIVATDVSVSFKGHKVLKEVSLVIERCDFVGILGGSGQGKSTFMNALCGLRPPEDGRVTINGADVVRNAGAAQALVGFVPQDDIVHTELTVEQAVRFSARLRLPSKTPAKEIEAMVDRVIEQLGLAEHRVKRISKLSGGQRKRVSIATELLSKPAALFLDEPSSGLDPATEFELMSLLRQLAGNDCTVVCTTHVLGRAYLFDQLCFIQAGRLVFAGPGAECPAYFGVEALDDVYLKLAKEGAATMPAQDTVTAGDRLVASAEIAERSQAAAPAPRRGASPVGTFWTLLRRQWAIWRSDLWSVVFLAAQPILIGLLVGWVSPDLDLRLFLALVATLWFGCSNGAQQIIRELPVFRRERVSGQSTHAYLLSKFSFLMVITCVQAMLLWFVVQGTTRVIHDPAFDSEGFGMKYRVMNNTGPDASTPLLGVHRAAGRFFEVGSRVDLEGKVTIQKVVWTGIGIRALSLAAAALVGVSIGLTISALVTSATQAVMWVPLILIPQILLGGFVITRPEMTKAVLGVSQWIPSFCTQRLMDVSAIYGLRRPVLTNQTEHAVYLSGRKKTVKWGGGQQEEFDEVSRENSSWQNLVTDIRIIGQHIMEPRQTLTGLSTDMDSAEIREVLIYNRVFASTVQERRDVSLKLGETYADLSPVKKSTLILGGWIVAAYAISFFGLRRSGSAK